MSVVRPSNSLFSNNLILSCTLSFNSSFFGFPALSCFRSLISIASFRFSFSSSLILFEWFSASSYILLFSLIVFFFSSSFLIIPYNRSSPSESSAPFRDKRFYLTISSCISFLLGESDLFSSTITFTTIGYDLRGLFLS